MPIYNEESIIERTIKSLLKQNLPNYEVEIFAIDGNSNDATAKIIKDIAKCDSRIKYIFNQKRKTPIAFNMGIEASNGYYIAILGAHTIYKKNYIYECINELERTKSVGCSGMVQLKTFKKKSTSKLTYWVLTSKFGVSSQSFRIQSGGFVKSLPYPIFKKDIIKKIGGYNEKLHRNQDNDLNYRLIDNGYKLYLTDKTSSKYYVDSSLEKLYKYSFKNGMWNAKSIFINYRSMRLHHILPAFFVFYVLSLTILIILMIDTAKTTLLAIYFIPIFLYLFLSMLETSLIIINNKSVECLRLPLVFFKFHFFYGLGFIVGFIRNLFS